ncbi:hypothetical protein EJB05_33577 [Eragrostis curvula]|uniref:Uncharacterized protein n=1 Tax=Eragrostis curvula TaxID=38414 RepID=A0A5J9U1Q4_9POAL|nr:hypothetical protein EJB05_33577 [Eragrostis curvula]
MSSVRIHRTSTVILPTTNLAPLPLSPFDAMFVSSEVPLNYVYMYPSPTTASFPELAESLKHSLAQTLQSFHPFAGELTYLSSSRTIAIVFPDARGVAFIEAESTDIGLKGLLDAEELDTEALRLLVPDIRRDVLPAPVMAVQVTQVVGGVVVGFALDHTVADGHGLFHFLNAWTAAAATGRSGSSNPKPLPLHDRNLVRFDGEEEFNRAVLRHFTPNLPRIREPKLHPTAEEQQRPVIQETFVFTATALQHLKQRRHIASTNPVGEQLVPSTFVAIAAHGWVSFSRAISESSADDDKPVFILFLVDCRPTLMSLPADQVYAGNCVVFCKAGLKGSELTAPNGITRALWTLTKVVKEAKADPLKYKAEVIADNQGDRMFVVSGIPRFGYELDVGFGRPARIERARLGYHSEACLMAGREPGSVHAMVAMPAENMPAFRQAFMVDGVQGRP